MKSLVEYIHESLKSYNPCSFSALKRNHKELYKVIEKDPILSEIAKIKGILFHQDPMNKFKNIIEINMFDTPDKNKERIEQIKEITGKYVKFQIDRNYWDDGYTSKRREEFGFYNINNGLIYDEYETAKEEKEL